MRPKHFRANAQRLDPAGKVEPAEGEDRGGGHPAEDRSDSDRRGGEREGAGEDQHVGGEESEEDFHGEVGGDTAITPQPRDGLRSNL